MADPIALIVHVFECLHAIKHAYERMTDNWAECKRLCMRVLVFEEPLNEIRAGRKTGNAEALKVRSIHLRNTHICTNIYLSIFAHTRYTHTR